MTLRGPSMPRSPMIAVLEAAVFNRRPLVIALFAVITVVMGWFATQLRIDAGFTKLLPLDHPYMQTFVKYRGEFGGANRVLIAIMAGLVYPLDHFLHVRERERFLDDGLHVEGR